MAVAPGNVMPQESLTSGNQAQARSFASGGSCRAPNSKWITLPSHRGWLLREAEALSSFFVRHIIDLLGGSPDLDDEGRPTAPGCGEDEAGQVSVRDFKDRSRLRDRAPFMGRPGADAIISHGMEFCGIATATTTTEGTTGRRL